MLVVAVPEIVMTVTMTRDSTAISVGLFGGQGVGSEFGPGIFSLPPLSSEKNSDNVMSSMMDTFIRRKWIRVHCMPMKESYFYPPSTVWPSSTHLPGGTGAE